MPPMTLPHVHGKCSPKNAEIPKTLRVRHWEVREAYGWLWLFWGKVGGELPEIQQLERDATMSKGNIRYSQRD